MYVMHIALGGCISQPPIRYGLTQDTGGHIAYVLGAAQAQARRPEVRRVDILTRLFDDPALGPDHAVPVQQIGPRLRILRLKGPSAAYRTKEALEAELPALTGAFLDMLSRSPCRPDILHCHFADAAELGAAARARFGIPMVYTPHSLAIDKRGCVGGDCSDRIRRERAAIIGADAIIASSRDEAERQIAAYDPGSAGRVWRINPGISLPAAADDGQARRRLADGLDRPDLPFLLAIARPVEKKNLAGLMRAYRDCPDLQDAANLVIVAGQDGSEPEQRAVRAELAALARGLPGRVLLPARHDTTLVPQLYRLAAAQGGVFVNPALHEPFGLTLIEAARFGLPVVATRNGGPVDILGTIGHGRLADPLSGPQLADACLGILRDRGEWRRLSRNALANHRQFDWDAWADRLSLIARRLTRKTAPLRPASLPRTVLAFDIDGTLTGCPRSAAAFARWMGGAPRRRQHAVIATGRSLPEARRILADWALPETPVIITSVGSEIWRADRRGSLALCGDYADWIGQDWQPDAIRGLLADMPVAWQAPCDQRRWKISLSGTESQALDIRDALARAGLAARVVPSHGRFIDILPQRAGKAGALSFEAARLGLGLTDCIAAGDSGNDACMLAAAGRAIVVGNALAELRLADRPDLYRASARHAAGVIEGLEHFGLTDRPAARAIPAE
ncbi:glycosyltransferase [Paracoccus sediminis]|uniref:sucrose-phosphate synthase n=1 Tax=Paracoccus sediminis TaxID=1214787 RepID=A0A238WL17_9RHOB|nr:HAD family hydrolase [Paracoccus sediminis]TBN50504.1 glycosyltransferase [Paracoccus sediminis]SNR47260.1 sucrose-phosphate synthase [Paracoccus sediminis]